MQSDICFKSLIFFCGGGGGGGGVACARAHLPHL